MRPTHNSLDFKNFRTIVKKKGTKMAKIINIDTKTRTIRVENDGKIKAWRTTESGAHFPIKEGESTKEALDKFVGSKRPEAKKDKKKYIEFEEQGQTYRFPKPTKHEKLWDQAWKNVEESRRYSAPAPGGNATAEHTPEETEEEVRAEYKKLKTAERAKQAKEKQQPAKKDKNTELYDRIGEYAKTHKLPLDEQEHLVALRKMLKADKNSTEHVKRNFEKWFDSKKEQEKTTSTKSDSALVSAVAKALGTSAEDAETEINGAVRHIKDLIKAKDLRNGDVEETLQGLGLEPDYAEEFMQWVGAPDKKTSAKKGLDNIPEKDRKQLVEAAMGPERPKNSSFKERVSEKPKQEDKTPRYISSKADLDELYQKSQSTIIGAGGDLKEWIDGISDWMKENDLGEMKGITTYKGADVNAAYGLKGNNRFPDDVTFLSWTNDGIKNIGKYAVQRFGLGIRWFDDIIDNSVDHNENEE